MRFLLRSLMRRPAFAVVAIGTIAVAIAANTAIFARRASRVDPVTVLNEEA